MLGREWALLFREKFFPQLFRTFAGEGGGALRGVPFGKDKPLAEVVALLIGYRFCLGLVAIVLFARGVMPAMDATVELLSAPSTAFPEGDLSCGKGVMTAGATDKHSLSPSLPEH
jgi:hypothetical protein